MLPACHAFALIGGQDARRPRQAKCLSSSLCQGAVLTKSKLSLEFVTNAADSTWIGVFGRNDRNSLAPHFP